MARRLTPILVLLLAAGFPSAHAQEVVPAEPGVIRIPVAPPGQPIVIRPGQMLVLPGDTPGFELATIKRDRHFASDTNDSGPLDAHIAALRSSRYEERDEATTALLRLHPDRLNEIRSLLAREQDAEAAARLTQVAIHLYLKARTPLEGQSSFMGIKFNPEFVRTSAQEGGELGMSIAVMELQPGYPAAQELRVGDRLLAIEGKRFPVDMPREMFPSMIQAHRPGQIVSFTILRNGREQDVKVQLAGLAAAGVINREQLIEQRNASTLAFVAGLETGRKEKPLVIQDKTTPVAQPMHLLQE